MTRSHHRLSARAFIGLGAALSSVSCAGVTVRSGKAPGQTAPAYEERWHSTFLYGALAGERPYDLSQICSAGWAEIHVYPDAFTSLVGLVTLFIYSPSRITIVCAAEHVDIPPPLRTFPVPGQPAPSPDPSIGRATPPE
jgi:hypothetical protein